MICTVDDIAEDFQANEFRIRLSFSFKPLRYKTDSTLYRKWILNASA